MSKVYNVYILGSDGGEDPIHVTVGIYKTYNEKQFKFDVFLTNHNNLDNVDCEKLMNDILSLDLNLEKHGKLKELIENNEYIKNEKYYNDLYFFKDIVKEYYNIVGYEKLREYYYDDSYEYYIDEETLI